MKSNTVRHRSGWPNAHLHARSICSMVRTFSAYYVYLIKPGQRLGWKGDVDMKRLFLIATFLRE